MLLRFGCGTSAYLRLVVKGAQRHGEEGWRTYDVLFRKLAATKPTLELSQPQPSLHSSFTASAHTFYEHCLEGNHESREHALTPSNVAMLLNQAQLDLVAAAPVPRHWRTSEQARSPGPGFANRSVCKRWNFSSTGCNAWLSGFHFRRVCLRCGKRNHNVVECEESQQQLPGSSRICLPNPRVRSAHVVSDGSSNLNGRPCFIKSCCLKPFLFASCFLVLLPSEFSFHETCM